MSETDQATQDLLKLSAPDLITKTNETKAFTFRALEPALHLTWKTCAAMSGVSMEEFGVAAIRAYIKEALAKRQEQE